MNTYTAEELATRDDHRDEIRKLMLEGSWHGSTTRRELAARWSTYVAEIHRLENEAAGAIRAGRPDDCRNIVEAKMAELDALKAVALDRKKVVVIGSRDSQETELVSDPDFRTAHSCIRTQLEIMGALKRPGDKVPAGKTDEGFDDMTASQQAAMLRQAADELDGKRGPLQ